MSLSSLKQQRSFHWWRPGLPEGFLIKSHFFKTPNPSSSHLSNKERVRFPQRGQRPETGGGEAAGRPAWSCPCQPAGQCGAQGRGSMLGLWGRTSFCGLLQSEQQPSNLGLITVGTGRSLPVGGADPYGAASAEGEAWALGTHSRLLLIATGRWGACTVTPGSEDPLRDGVGGGPGGAYPRWADVALFWAGFILRLEGVRGRCWRREPPAGPGPTPPARLILGGWPSFAGTPTRSQPCLQTTLLT